MPKILNLDYVSDQNKWRAKVKLSNGRKSSVFLRYDTFIDANAVVLGQFLLMHWLGTKP